MNPPSHRTKIFLSYARDDDEPFVARFYEQLVGNDFDVWWDRKRMPSRALTFLKEIREAVNWADRVVVVIGPKCVNSDYFRAEWQAALAETKVVNPLLRLGDYELLPPELANLHCPDFRDDARFDDAMSEAVRVLTEPLPPLGALLGAPPDLPPHFQPRPDAISDLARVLFVDETQPVVLTGPERVTVLHGMGGTGKSVMAATFARSTSTRRSFGGGIYWLDSGEEARALGLAAQFARLLKTPPEGHADLATCLSDLTNALESRGALVVIDNAWRVEQLEPLIDVLGPSCRLLVTTRIGELATAVGASAVELRELSPEAALDHLADWAGTAATDLPPEAKEIAAECGLLPFALALNGAMHEQGVSWSHLLDALRAAEIDFAEQRFKGYPHPNVLSSIAVSMDALDAKDAGLGHGLRELAVFRAGAAIPEAAVAVLWAHTGACATRHVSKMLTRLAGRALVRLDGPPDRRRVLIHDLQLDYLHRVTDAGALNESLLTAYEEASAGDWTRVPADGYIHRHLIAHLRAARRSETVDALFDQTTELGANAWFEANTIADNLVGYLADLDHLREETQDEARAVHLSLILSSVRTMLGRIPSELHASLIGAGETSGSEALASLGYVDDPERRVTAILELVPELDETSRREALTRCTETVRARGDQVRGRFLPRIAAHLDGEDRTSLIAEGLAAARAVGSPEYRAQGLAAALEVLEEPLLGQVAQEAAAALEQSVGSRSLRDDLAAVAPHAPGLAKCLLDRARQIGQPFVTSMAFEAIVPHLPEAARAAAALEGIQYFEASKANGLWIVVGLAAHIPGYDLQGLIWRAATEDPRQVPYLVESLPRMLSGQSLDSAIGWIAEAAGEFPEPNCTRTRIALLSARGDAGRVAQIEGLLRDIEDLPENTWRRDAYVELMPYLPPDQLMELSRRLARLEDAPSVLASAATLAALGDEALRREVFSRVVVLGPSCEKFVALAGLSLAPQDAQHEAVLEAAYALRDDVHGWARMTDPAIAVASQLEPAKAEELLEAAWHAALRGGGFPAEDEFMKLAPALSQGARESGFRHLLEDSERLSRHRQEYWGAGGRGLTENHQAVAETLARIASALPESLLAVALEAVDRMQAAPWRWVALCHVLPRLDGDAYARARNKLHALAADINLEAEAKGDADFARAMCRGLGSLIPCLGEHERESMREKLWSLLGATEAGWLPGLMEDVAPALMPEQREALAKRSLAQPNVFTALAAGRILGEARQASLLLESLRGIPLGRSVDPVYMDLLASTVESLLTAPVPARHDAWREARTRLQGERAAVASHLAVLAPLASSLGDDAILSRAAKSLLMVQAWWP